jgi:hypothetical protein
MILSLTNGSRSSSETTSVMRGVAWPLTADRSEGQSERKRRDRDRGGEKVRMS